MKDVYEILRQREMDCARLRKEIEALRIVIPLLVEEDHTPEPIAQEREIAALYKTGTDGSDSLPPAHSGWSFWKRRRETEE